MESDLRKRTFSDLAIEPIGPNKPFQISGSIKLVIILALTFLAYAQTLSFDFIIDDEAIILGNASIRSWENAMKGLNSHLFQGFDSQLMSNIYRPFWLLWETLCYSLFQYHPAGWHLGNILLHVLATFLTYIFVRRLTDKPDTALLACMIFGLHPAHTESVAWVSGGMDILASLFILLTMILIMDFLKGGSRNRQVIRLSMALISSAAAMLVKETGIITPLMVALCAGMIPNQVSPVRRITNAVRIALPFFLLAALYLILRVVVLGKISGTSSDIPLDSIILTWPYLVSLYSKLLIIPFNYSLYYPYLPVTAFLSLRFFIPIFLIGLVTAVLIYWSRLSGVSKHVSFACGLMIIPLIPVFKLDLLPRHEIIHTRFLYLPLLGFALLAALALESTGRWLDRQEIVPAVKYSGILILAGLLFASVTVESRPFRNNFTIYSRAIQIAPKNSIVRVNLANQYVLRHDTIRAFNLYEEILIDDPEDWLTNYNAGYTSYLLGKSDQAIRYFTQSITINPSDSDQFAYLALAHLRIENVHAAGVAIGEAIHRRPDGKSYNYILGMVHKIKGNYQEAAGAFEMELSFHPEFEEAKKQLESVRSGIFPDELESRK